MSVYDIEKFYLEVKNNDSLREELESVKKEILVDRLSPLNAEDFLEQGLIPLAKKYGWNFSLDDLMDYASRSRAELLEHKAKLLSEGALEAVSGGKIENGMDAFLLLYSFGIV